MMSNEFASRRKFCSLRSHNLRGGTVSPREDLLESYYLHLNISNLFNRNKSGSCAPYKSKEAHSYESELSTSGPLCLLPTLSADLFLSCAVLFADALSDNRQIVNKISLRFQQNLLKVNTNIVLYQNLVKDAILQI